jgi:hypothetical protein
MGLAPEHDKGSYLTPTLAILALLGWIARLLSAPDWVFVVLIAAAAPAAVWLVWALIKNHRDGRRYSYPTMFFLFLLGWIAERLSAPTWVFVALIAAWVVVLPWVIWTVVKDRRSEGPG